MTLEDLRGRIATLDRFIQAYESRSITPDTYSDKAGPGLMGGIGILHDCFPFNTKNSGRVYDFFKGLAVKTRNDMKYTFGMDDNTYHGLVYGEKYQRCLEEKHRLESLVEERNKETAEAA